MNRIASAVGSHPVYLDVMRLTPTLPVMVPGGERPVLECLFEAGRSRGMRFVPVMWVGEGGAEHRRIIRDAALQDGYGVALRYRLRKYVLPMGAGLEDCVTEELTSLQRDVSEADLIVDLEYIDPDDEVDVDGLASSLSEMLGVGPWRSFVILGTSIPSTMSCIVEGSVGSIPRKEWELWSQLQQCDLDRMPAFGDYAIQNPFPPHVGGGPGMRANIRYTADGDTLVARGRGPFYEEGNEQYRGLCKQLVARTEFAGPEFSWGDEVIYDCSLGALDPGSQRTWRGAGTSHHFREVSEQLVTQTRS